VFWIASEEVGCYGGHGGRDAVDRDEEVLGARGGALERASRQQRNGVVESSHNRH
jgi:hypothetical protein